MTLEEIKKVVDYCPASGIFTWKKRVSQRSPQGGVAGYYVNHGYRQLCIRGNYFSEHRVAWAIVNGEWPENELDHINGIPCDNRIFNLRPATHAQNSKNRKIQTSNKSGLKGVTWDKQKRLWKCGITTDGKRKFLGYFKDKEEAGKAYILASIQLHGQFSRTK